MSYSLPTLATYSLPTLATYYLPTLATYSSVFVRAAVSTRELPLLSMADLQSLGLPLGPRLAIERLAKSMTWRQQHQAADPPKNREARLELIPNLGMS